MRIPRVYEQRSRLPLFVRAIRRGIAVALVTVAAALGGAPAHGAVTAQPVATNLAFPAAFTFAPDGRIFYAERLTGEIRIFNPVTSTDTLFFTVPNLATAGEQGVLGLALAPDYPFTPHVYAFATRVASGVASSQILRITDTLGAGSAMQVIFTARAATTHVGGRILFGPDRMLYAVIGDTGVPAYAQDLGRRVGKILRMTDSGAVPADNPYRGSHVFAYGIRNSFGFGFDPATGQLWQTENGPRCNDELNRIMRGRNYGWGPSQTCSRPPNPPLNTNRDGPNPVLPQRWYTPAIAPTGAAFCSRCGLGSENEGRLFFGAWNTGELRRVTLDATRRSVVSQSIPYRHGAGILAVERAPGGALYFSGPKAIFVLRQS